jgi:hypothetical protein
MATGRRGPFICRARRSSRRISQRRATGRRDRKRTERLGFSPKELGPRDGFSQGATIPTFPEFWNEHRDRVTQTLVERVGEDVNRSDLWTVCTDLGIDGLLAIRCIRLAVGAMIALIYSHFYNAGQQIPKVRQSDAADIRHVIAASAAETFVSNDLRLCKRLSAIPMNDRFRVLHLDKFLSDLQTRGT